MNKISVTMDNCFGITHMNHEFDFSNSNVIAIYARNGMMKTSFAKTFQKIQGQKIKEIKDELFDINGTVTVECDGKALSSENIFVIKSFENSYEADVTTLLINPTIKEHLENVFKARDLLFKELERMSGLKIKKTLGGKTIYELEPKIIEDFGFNDGSFLGNVTSFQNRPPKQKFDNISYSDLFDDSVLKIITSDDFQEKIREFIEKSEEIYNSYGFLEKGKFTLPKLKDLYKSLEKNNFFVHDNGIILTGIEQINDTKALKKIINEIDEQIKAVPQFTTIEKKLTNAKGTVLKDIIESTPELIAWLTPKQLPDLKKTLWLSYLQSNNNLLEDLCKKYGALSDEINSVSLDDTQWKKALEIYKERFHVPYKMGITNLKSVIIGESIPRVKFVFSKKNMKDVEVSRNKLEELDTLSQGEKRALYLLNIIFEIEKIKQSGKETLFIIDDIADSFDYKNKYAIVEYIYELAEDPKFNMIILSHNFDFYRTISSRLGLNRECRLFADNVNGEIKLTKEFYQNQPFNTWKKEPTKKNVIALVPFVRNLVEYGRDNQVNGSTTDFSYLTNLLHEKENTHNMNFSDLVKIYKEYLGVEQLDSDILQDKIIECLYSICDSLTTSDTKLENKIVLAIAIRHRAEEFMIQKIQDFKGSLLWKVDRKTQKSGSSVEFLKFALTKSNQTRELFNGYKQIKDMDKIKILEEVNIITPENIHLNSFMYEPILDMDVNELLALYQKVKIL